jgi:hypothetical protein
VLDFHERSVLCTVRMVCHWDKVNLISFKYVYSNLLVTWQWIMLCYDVEGGGRGLFQCTVLKYFDHCQLDFHTRVISGY